MATASPQRRGRRPLSHVGGSVELDADPSASSADLEILERALSVDRSERATRAHVHGFHSYPARLHPSTARALVDGLSQPGALVLDPFCGSGTVVVEAALLGRRAVGSDLSPLAVALAGLKTGWRRAEDRERLLAAASIVAEKAEHRRRARAGPTRPYARIDRDLFDPHVLLELDGLRAAIRAVGRGDVREALLLVLSSILVKVSRQQSDTSRRRAPRRLASGFTIRLFSRKTEELARRLETAAGLLPDGAPRPRLVVADARRLDAVRPGSVALVVTSPPYPGVYDYAEQHAARLRWLDLDPGPLRRGEIGSRRLLAKLEPGHAIGRWKRDLGAALARSALCLQSRGAVALVVADAALGSRALEAVGIVRSVAPRAGLRVVVAASQRRPAFGREQQAAFRRQPRREHLILLRPR